MILLLIKSYVKKSCNFYSYKGFEFKECNNFFVIKKIYKSLL